MIRKGFFRYTTKRALVIIIILSFIINIFINTLECGKLLIINCDLSFKNEAIRMLQLDFSLEKAKDCAADMNIFLGDYITVLMILNDFKLTDKDLEAYSKSEIVFIRNRLIKGNNSDFKQLSNLYNALILDFSYFPVPKSINNAPWVSFIDSWGYDRSYGGNRKHEGTDIMAKKNISGKYPLLSVCNGTVTNIGWLELGGYRIGITSENGVYYYYAHLSSYADLAEGSKVTAGHFLGFMGNTGYSQIEGTAGKFDVHLHFGIYVSDKNGEEISLNPYYLLKHRENKVLYYNYEI